jgi:hypothetical protein
VVARRETIKPTGGYRLWIKIALAPRAAPKKRE